MLKIPKEKYPDSPTTNYKLIDSLLEENNLCRR